MVKAKNEKAIKKIQKVVEQKEAQEKIQKPIENGTWILIMLSWDILMGWFLFKKNLPYKVDKAQFVELEKHTRILGIAMQIL